MWLQGMRGVGKVELRRRKDGRPEALRVAFGRTESPLRRRSHNDQERLTKRHTKTHKDHTLTSNDHHTHDGHTMRAPPRQAKRWAAGESEYHGNVALTGRSPREPTTTSFANQQRPCVDCEILT